MMQLDELVRQLQLAYGGGLRSVVLFGSAVAGEHNPKKSDYNVLVIVDSLPLERLRAVAAVSKAWAEDGNPPPMTFTTSEWKSSSDIFPMEYADILERHRVHRVDFGRGSGVAREVDHRAVVDVAGLGAQPLLERGQEATRDAQRRRGQRGGEVG